MKSNTLLLLILIVLVVGGAIYYKQHTKTASIDLPGGKGISITTHD